MTHASSPVRIVVAEGLGTLLLVAVVVGSGIMAERLSAGNVALALLANTLATGAGLFALITTFGSVSGAHFNPVVTCAHALERHASWRRVPAIVLAQVVGAVCGTLLAHVMFGVPLVTLSTHVRATPGEVTSEAVATFGLLAVMWGVSRSATAKTAAAVACYIVAAYWFTASTSFANPAVTIARTLTDTFAGIAPSSAPAFIAAQLVGATAATLLFRWLIPAQHRSAP